MVEHVYTHTHKILSWILQGVRISPKHASDILAQIDLNLVEAEILDMYLVVA